MHCLIKCPYRGKNLYGTGGYLRWEDGCVLLGTCTSTSDVPPGYSALAAASYASACTSFFLQKLTIYSSTSKIVQRTSKVIIQRRTSKVKNYIQVHRPPINDYKHCSELKCVTVITPSSPEPDILCCSRQSGSTIHIEIEKCKRTKRCRCMFGGSDEEPIGCCIISLLMWWNYATICNFNINIAIMSLWQGTTRYQITDP
jgi:hypothetical protein